MSELTKTVEAVESVFVVDVDIDVDMELRIDQVKASTSSRMME
jgi:hypothetical protein